MAILTIDEKFKIAKILHAALNAYNTTFTRSSTNLLWEELTDIDKYELVQSINIFEAISSNGSYPTIDNFYNQVKRDKEKWEYRSEIEKGRARLMFNIIKTFTE